MASRGHSGIASSGGSHATSTSSTHRSTMLQLITRERRASETKRSVLQSLSRKGLSVQVRNGPTLGPSLLGQSVLPFPTEWRNYSLMKTTSRSSSAPRRSKHTTRLFNTTSLSETSTKGDSNASCLTQCGSKESMLPLSSPTALRRDQPPAADQIRVAHGSTAEEKHPSVGALMRPAGVKVPGALTDMSARHAGSQGTAKKPVMVARNEHYGLNTKYLRHNVWDEDSIALPFSTSRWTETARPLASIPLAELNNFVASKTVHDHPHLFKIVTPIDVDKFESLLRNHPNPEFVESVCKGLREGFWPWADTLREGYPTTHNASYPSPPDEQKAAFLRAQRNVEIAKGRFSEAFGNNLLPGMYASPIHAVPKSDSTDLRMVTDHSAGDFSLNSMIHHELVTGYPLDNMKYVGAMLLKLRQSLPENSELVMWKADIAEAYCLMPMHPHWQLKQTNIVDGTCYVDRNLAFGSSASAAIFIAFNSLVSWIAMNVRGVERLATYIDDSSGCNLAGDVLFYKPYGRYFPRDQTVLLNLWDSIGIPHKERKQVFGAPLTVIGISVDPNAMTLTLPSEARLRLLKELAAWSTEPRKSENGQKSSKNSKKPVHFKLKRWQQMSGWTNYAFNVYPLLKACLNNFYPKMAGKSKAEQCIYTNTAVRADFHWARAHIEASDGVRVLNSRSWGESDADCTFYYDVSLEGLGFWDTNHNLGFYAPSTAFPSAPNDIIFQYKALCVLSALEHIHQTSVDRRRVIIHTDSSNTFDIFNSLRCQPAYNHILKSAIDILIDGSHDLRVLHVPGIENSVADALSHFDFARAESLSPGLKIQPLQPPRLMLGHTKK
ncbi:hypothetical protein HYPSUDRAFT_143936 [Hypholoma sublateritium FD-334 SS-4]|uniref:Uncharacterized protein n=1 Tax=Hypholoma sublateritium (strain FD-334 SS-4) TaxID=945553 RepID=A0A0D2KXN5_HYPSF|nr:hypothetical protein HYPSUDRAFT_143936 [Hypholoma sublateritium FD-334 SS-4]